MNREPKAGDTIYITKLNDKDLDVPHEVTVVDVSYYKDFDTSLIEFRPKIGITRLLYQDNSPIDEWHFEPPTQNNVYDDDAISPSYSEAVRAGKTFADYTGAHITEESLNFKTKEDEIIEGITSESLNFQEIESDNVNHPSHYNYGDIEVIDFIEQVTSQYADGFSAYIVGNALKYLARSPHKNGDEDLKKAHWYLSRLLKRNEDG